MVMTSSIVNCQSSNHVHNDHLNRSLERAIEEATRTGELLLSARKLRQFPSSSDLKENFDLTDTIRAGSPEKLGKTFFCLMKICLFLSWRFVSKPFDRISVDFLFVSFVGICKSLSKRHSVDPRTNRNNFVVENDWSEVKRNCSSKRFLFSQRKFVFQPESTDFDSRRVLPFEILGSFNIEQQQNQRVARTNRQTRKIDRTRRFSERFETIAATNRLFVFASIVKLASKQNSRIAERFE